MTDPSRSPAVSDRAADMVALRRIIRELMVRDEPAFVEQRIDNFLTAIERAGWGLFLTGNMAALASRPSPERRTADAVLALLDDYANNPASATNVAAMAERIAIEVRSLTDKTNADPSPPAGEWQTRPVAFRVKNRAGEWCLFQHEEIAQAAADHLGVEYQGLYARTSAPVESGDRGEDKR